MTSRERLLAALQGNIPDCVPVAPDFSNMIPARLTGKPFWDLYLYQNPPIWEAYIACAKYFEIDSLMDGYFPYLVPPRSFNPNYEERFIVLRNQNHIVTQWSKIQDGQRVWAPVVDVFCVADPPSYNVRPEKMGLPSVPARYEPLEGVRPVDTGPEGLKKIKNLMAEQGLVGVWLASTNALGNEEAIFNYYDHPELHEQWSRARIETVERRFAEIMSKEVKPDFLCVGGSGTLIFQTPQIFRQLALPAVKRAVELATTAGIPTHVHSCGPEKELVKILAGETDLTVIDPLEIPPMGDCNLADIKKRYGRKLVLKGNLHTTEVMLRGKPEEVMTASRKAIDDAARGGRFILSTGDQCGRDTPFENIRAMIETARTYGKY